MWGVAHLRWTDYAACFCAGFMYVVLSRRDKRNASRLPSPPGPPRFPVIGNLHQMPSSHLWEKAVEWGKQYGDLIYVENLGHSMLIINSYEKASELLDTRSAIYSSRPRMVMIQEMQEFGWPTSLLPYGEAHRRQRAHLHRFFQTSEVLNYFELQERETHVMLNGILHAPENYAEHVRRLPGAVILRNVYGHEVQKINDPFVQLGEKIVRSGGAAMDYHFLDFVPWLKHLPNWFPGVTFPTFAKEGRELSKQGRSVPHEVAKDELKRGTGKECMTSILLSENMLEDGSIYDEQNICDAAATAYIAGSDTSTTAIMTFVLAMLKHPEKQRRAQKEIDDVIGQDRLPNLSDKDLLPYVQAICTETFRWEVIVPFSVAHCLTEDDDYMGYHIPAGTMVLPNVWAMSRNSVYYSEPLSFKPERWIPGENGDDVPTLRPQEYIFGFGRRVCPGQNWAENIVVFLAAATILATFNIEQAVGENGQHIPPNDQLTPSPIRTLGPSKCKITPRSEKTASLIRQAFASL